MTIPEIDAASAMTARALPFLAPETKPIAFARVAWLAREHDATCGGCEDCIPAWDDNEPTEERR